MSAGRLRSVCVMLISMLVAIAVQAGPPPPETSQILVLLNLPAQHFRPDANYAGSYADAGGRVAKRRVASQLAREYGLTMVSDWPMPLLGLDCCVMSAPPEHSAERISQSMSRDARVTWVQPLNLYEAQGHDDPLFSLQPAAAEWQMAALHERVQGRNIRIAIVDSAIERGHPDLVGRVESADDFVVEHLATAENHGTAVAGIVAAEADNGVGIVGVAPQARLIALRACWELPSTRSTLCDTLSLAKALYAAISHKAQIINLSLSGPQDRLLGMLIDTALERGITVVAAVDNEAPNGGFPASHRGVIAVGDELLSTRGGNIVFAPGRDVPTTVTGRRWALVSGTSYAAAL